MNINRLRNRVGAWLLRLFCTTMNRAPLASQGEYCISGLADGVQYRIYLRLDSPYAAEWEHRRKRESK